MGTETLYWEHLVSTTMDKLADRTNPGPIHGPALTANIFSAVTNRTNIHNRAGSTHQL